MEAKDRLEEWNEWKEDIWAHIRWLCRSRDTFRVVLGVAKRNPHLGQSNSFCWWMFANYGYGAAIAIRRMLDRGKDVISLARLVVDMANHPARITLARLQSYPAGSRERAEKVFSRYAADCGECLSPERVTAALAKVERSAKGVRKFVNKVIAHPTTERPRLPFSAINQPLQDIIDLFKDIDILLGGTGDLFLNQLGVPDESDPAFTRPWIQTQPETEGET